MPPSYSQVSRRPGGASWDSLRFLTSRRWRFVGFPPLRFGHASVTLRSSRLGRGGHAYELSPNAVIQLRDKSVLSSGTVQRSSGSMRILVADQNALLLAAITATFGRHCEIVTATRRDKCMEHVEGSHFDLVVACEKLADYTGLELLSEVEAVSPATLRIFAARPQMLKRLGTRLDFFGLLGTLHYPIEARKLLIALKVARARLPGRPKPPQVKHVVLESEWDTGERLALLGQEMEEAPEAVRETAVAESPVAQESAPESWATPASAAENTMVQPLEKKLSRRPQP